MSTNVPRHEWVIAPFRADRDSVVPGAGIDWLDIDAHRNFRGPYTAAGELIHRLIRRFYAPMPDLCVTHQVTLLSVAPDLVNHIRVSDEVVRLLAFSREGDPPSWTLRFAHGLTDFILGCVARAFPARLSVSFENVDLAEPLDREFIAVLLRRADPERLTVKVCSSCDRLDDPLLAALNAHTSVTYLEPIATTAVTKIPDVWRAWLRERVAGWAGEWRMLNDISEYVDLSATAPPSSDVQEFLDYVVSRMLPDQRRTLANQYVRSECVSDNLLLKHAYAGVPSAERKALHRTRATELEVLGRRSGSLGAIPFHHEQAAAETAPLLAASNRCMHLAFYESALDWALRGRHMLAAADRGAAYCEFTRNALFSLLLLGRFDELEALCDENQTLREDPALLVHTAYAKAILNARFYKPSHRDYDAARVWVEKSRSFTEMLPSSEGKAVNIAFLRNTMALVEMRTGRPAIAHELLTSAIHYLKKEAPGRYEKEAAILLQNRARLQVSLKQLSGAIDDLTTLLQHQPCSTEAYFERGVLFQRLGRHEEALRDYNAAIQWSPPYPEAYFNRAQTLVSLGRFDEAIIDYEYILTLAPDHIEALNSRARLLFDRANFDASRADVERALRINPTHARLLCLRGLLDIRTGNLNRAYESFTKSIEADPSLADAWANRATVLFKQGDLNGSWLDLTRALSLREDGAAYYNRGRVLEAQEMWAEAIDDYSRALKLSNGDVRHILRHRALCLHGCE